jgi:peptidoglycan/xylan/chitin deacetylase (PgdA/CDA1 family)
MRPPEGELDDASTNVLASLGYSVVLWDVDTKDYQSENLALEQPIVEQVVGSDVAGQTPGHIILQHDVHSQSALELTPWVVDYVLAKNYTFVTISECLGIQPYQ